jgi:hypothetical protein
MDNHNLYLNIQNDNIKDLGCWLCLKKKQSYHHSLNLTESQHGGKKTNESHSFYLQIFIEHIPWAENCVGDQKHIIHCKQN